MQKGSAKLYIYLNPDKEEVSAIKKRWKKTEAIAPVEWRTPTTPNVCAKSSASRKTKVIVIADSIIRLQYLV